MVQSLNCEASALQAVEDAPACSLQDFHELGICTGYLPGPDTKIAVREIRISY